jgi:hypothetical protein
VTRQSCVDRGKIDTVEKQDQIQMRSSRIPILIITGESYNSPLLFFRELLTSLINAMLLGYIESLTQAASPVALPYHFKVSSPAVTKETTVNEVNMHTCSRTR